MGEILLMLLTGGGSTALGAMLKGGFGMYLRVAAKSTSLKWPEKAVQMKIFLNSKLNWLKEVIMSLLVLVGVLLLSWGCSRSAPQYYFQRAFLQSNGSVSQTPPEKVEQSGYLDSYHTQQAKTQSLYLWDTYPIWGRRLCGILGFYFGPSPHRR